MRTFLLAACGLLLVGKAQAQGTLTLGPLRMDMSVEQAMASLPNAQWKEVRYQPSQLLSGAIATQAVKYAGFIWDVRFGDSEAKMPTPRRSLVLSRNWTTSSLSACQRDFSGAVAHFEKEAGFLLGALEGAPAAKLSLAMAIAKSSRVEKAGNSSRVRQVAWGKGNVLRYGWKPMEGSKEGFSFASLETTQSTNACSMEVGFSVEDLPAGFAPELKTPTGWTKQAIVDAKLNLARWGDQELMQWSHRAANDDPPLPKVEGYFAILEDQNKYAGLAKGIWRNTAGRWSFEGEYLIPHSLCGVSPSDPAPSADRIVYLGDKPLDEFSALDEELGGAAASRVESGQKKPEDTPQQFRVEPRIEYPSASLRAKEQGVVNYICKVEADQKLRCVSQKSPPKRLLDAANAAIRDPSVRYAATFPDGQSTAGFCVPVDFNFRIQ